MTFFASIFGAYNEGFMSVKTCWWVVVLPIALCMFSGGGGGGGGGGSFGNSVVQALGFTGSATSSVKAKCSAMSSFDDFLLSTQG